MSQKHLDDLRKALERKHWVVSKELEGNGYDVTGSWEVSRPDESTAFHIDFEGLDDLETLPINKAFGCRVRERTDVAAYFARVTRSWPAELASFIGELGTL